MYECTKLVTADLVLIGTTLFLGIVALFGWWVQRQFMKPKLVASYDHKEPMARLSARSVAVEPHTVKVYDFHFLVENKGKTPARKVVAVIVEFCYEDTSGELIKLKELLPVAFRYTTEMFRSNKEIVSMPVESVDVHPGRPYYWNIGTIPHKKMLELGLGGWKEEHLFSLPGKERNGLPFRLDLYREPYNQVNALYKGKHQIKVMLYSENAKPAEIVLEIDWKTGTWNENEDAMFAGIVIRKFDC